MALIFLANSNDTTTTIKDVGSIHFQPQLLDAATIAKGIEVEESAIPQPEQIPGKDFRLKYDTSNSTFIVEYVDRPLTPEEELQKLKEEQALMQQALDELILGGAL